MDNNKFFFQRYGLDRPGPGAVSGGGAFRRRRLRRPLLRIPVLRPRSAWTNPWSSRPRREFLPAAACASSPASAPATPTPANLPPERILHAARTAALIASGPSKTPIAGFKPEARAQPLSGRAPRWMRRCRPSWTWCSAPTGRPRLRSAHHAGAGQLCRRAAPHPGGRLRRRPGRATSSRWRA